MEEVCREEKDAILQETETVNRIIQSCMELRDNFLVLDVLEKKSLLLKQLTEDLLK